MEKRNFFRLDLTIEIEFSILNPKTIEVISNSHQGTLKDLSGGGISFTTKVDLAEDQLVEIKLTNNDKIFFLLGKVVRRVVVNDQEVYAAEFVHLDRTTQDQLVQLIFNTQRRERKIIGGGQ